MIGSVSWGFLKEKLFFRKTSHEFETRGMVVELCREIEEHSCRRIYYGNVSSVSRIGHMEQILTSRKILTGSRAKCISSMYSTFFFVINFLMSAIRPPFCMYTVFITFGIINIIKEFLFVVIMCVWTICHCFGSVAHLGFSAP